MNTSRSSVFTGPQAGSSPVLARSDGHILEIDVVARMHVRARDRRRHVRTFLVVAGVPRKVDERDVADQHLARPRRRAVVAAVLRDRWSRVGALHVEVREQDVADAAPAAAAGEAGALVRALRREDPRPRLDVRAVGHVVVVADDLVGRKINEYMYVVCTVHARRWLDSV